jgi:hypothetical protein
MTGHRVKHSPSVILSADPCRLYHRQGFAFQSGTVS